MKTFIAFTGVKGSGKTTSFDIIKEAYPAVIEVALAAKLKRACAEVFNIPRTFFDDPAVKEKDLASPVFLTQFNVEQLFDYFKDELQSVGVAVNYDHHVRQHIGTVLESPRRVAQYVGTEVLRNVYGDIHCLGATHGLPEEGVFVVTDMRFPNEFDFFKSRYPASFYPLYVSNYAAEAHVGPNSHASEKYVFEIAKQCERIDNNDSIESLKPRVLDKVREVLSRQGYQWRPIS